MTREEAFKEINRTQDDYVDQLIQYMNDPATVALKEINFTSPTGTGKTNMMAKLMNRLSDCYFIVTTLSKGQLKAQVQDSFRENCLYDNYTVYGSQDFKVNSILTGQDILSGIPEGKECIWLRDEGHIHTNNYMGLLETRCDKIINISATNQQQTGITCNFTHTMMLRTVNQQTGTPEDAINKLLEIKAQHSMISNYNPCAIFRLIKGDDDLYMRVIRLCEQHNLKYINISDDDYVMAELCKDDNPYDVIINKYKLVEGIDIRRAHVLYMDSQPDNDATTIQVIGRCRRNALLYRNDVDILANENEQLLKDTRECYVFYNVEKMKISTDETGELCYAFCPYISCEHLKLGATIEVENGQMPNGLYVYELMGQTGKFLIEKDEATGFNVVNPDSKFYKKEIREYNPSKYIYYSYHSDSYAYGKILASDLQYILQKENGRYVFVNEYITNNSEYKTKFIAVNKDEYSSNNNCTCNDYFTLENIKTYKPTQYIYYSYNISIYKKISIDNIYRLLKENFIDFKIYIYRIYKSEQYKKYFKPVDEDDLTKLNEHHTYYIGNPLLREGGVTLSSISLKTLTSTTEKYVYYSEHYKIWNKIAVSDLYNICINDKSFLSIKTLDIKDNPYSEAVYFDEFKSQHQDFNFSYYKLNDLLYQSKIQKFTYFYNNDIAIIGLDGFKSVKLDNTRWVENKAITSNINSYTKLNRYISEKYKNELTDAKNSLFTGKNQFALNRKCNSMLGYCVEYYSKYKVYGSDYLNNYIDKVILDICKKEFQQKAITNHLQDKAKLLDRTSDEIIIRACILKYKDEIASCYGKLVSEKISSISTIELIKPQYKDFIQTVVNLGTKTSQFVKETLYPDKEAQNNVLPVLQTRHIVGLADYITEDTILDIKVTNTIDETYIKQVLAYHYLSTMRSDLHIKRVMVYDATSGRSVTVNITPENLTQQSTFTMLKEVE